VILEEIAAKTGLRKEYLARIAGSASHRYKTYRIPKRKGGYRTIHHPSRQLKFIQGWLVDNLFKYFPIHDAVYSYRLGRGIKDLATLHLRNNYLLRVDFQDFFPSLLNSDVIRLLTSNNNRFPIRLSEEDYVIIASLVCRNSQLTIGAPCSPILSNAILHDFDTHWFEQARQTGVTYSRYADDLYFSTNAPNVLQGILRDLHSDLQQRGSPRLKINEAKTVFTSRKRKRLVTGLILTSTNQISVGRERKRHLKSLVYKFAQNRLEVEKVTYIRGFLSYIQGVEPSFLKRLTEKYGAEVLDRLSATSVGFDQHRKR